jgi:hypothetical protein
LFNSLFGKNPGGCFTMRLRGHIYSKISHLFRNLPYYRVYSEICLTGGPDATVSGPPCQMGTFWPGLRRQSRPRIGRGSRNGESKWDLSVKFLTVPPPANIWGGGHEDCAPGKSPAGLSLRVNQRPDAPWFDRDPSRCGRHCEKRRDIMRRPCYRQTCWPLTSAHLLEGSCR